MHLDPSPLVVQQRSRCRSWPLRMHSRRSPALGRRPTGGLLPPLPARRLEAQQVVNSGVGAATESPAQLDGVQAPKPPPRSRALRTGEDRGAVAILRNHGRSPGEATDGY
jgi:hypothetical protein